MVALRTHFCTKLCFEKHSSGDNFILEYCHLTYETGAQCLTERVKNRRRCLTQTFTYFKDSQDFQLKLNSYVSYSYVPNKRIYELVYCFQEKVLPTRLTIFLSVYLFFSVYVYSLLVYLSLPVY